MPEKRGEEENKRETHSPDSPASSNLDIEIPPTSGDFSSESDSRPTSGNKKKDTRLSNEFFILIGLGCFFTILSFVVYPYRSIAEPAAYPNIEISQVPSGAQIRFITYTVTPEKAEPRYTVNLEITVGGAYKELSAMILNLEYPRGKILTKCSITFPLIPASSPDSICPEYTGTEIKVHNVVDLDFTVNSINDYYTDDGAVAMIALPEVDVTGGSLPIFRARYYLQERAKRYDWSGSDKTINGSVAWAEQVPQGGYLSSVFETGADQHAQSLDNLRILVVGAFIAIACSAFFEAIRRLFKV
jgi:hypothetical protein